LARRDHLPGLLAGDGVGGADAVFGPRRHASISPLTQWLKLSLLLLTHFCRRPFLARAIHAARGEYFALLLLAAAGLMLLVSSDNLLMIFIALELLSISLYALACLRQGKPGFVRGGLEILSVRRHVGGVHAFWHQLGLRDCRLDIQLDFIAARLRGQPVEPVFLRGPGDDAGWICLQAGGGAVSSLGAGRL
jgi:hypothetical protein